MIENDVNPPINNDPMEKNKFYRSPLVGPTYDFIAYHSINSNYEERGIRNHKLSINPPKTSA